ncbi:MAG: NAD(P)-dependent oxidoreductase [Rhodocyclaceae bacterium]|nr:NAD(P)-dependent oxidoreductase [Rhodocyclaceae bacterium]
MTEPRTGIVGIGNMGLAMALNLLERGLPVGVRDLRDAPERVAADAGARVFASPAQMAAEVDLLILVVVDADQVGSILFGTDGAAAHLAPGSVVMVCSTVSPEDMAGWAERLGERGIDFIDGPISGGPARARDGSMTLMASGAATALDLARPVLAALASRVVAVGSRVGDGTRAKLMNNLLAGIHLAAAAEAFALAEHLGLDARTLLKITASSSGQSWIQQDRMSRALADDFEPRAECRILTKDLSLAMACAASAGFRTPLGDAALAQFRQACADGLSARDDGALLLTARRRLPAGSEDS